MAISLKHKFTNPKPDGPDATIVRPSNWNDEHDLVMGAGKVLGRTTAGPGPAEEIDFNLAGLVATPPSTGDGLVFDGTTWGAGPAGGGMFKGNNGTVGSRSGDIFRVNVQLLDANTTIAATENASATGPLEIDDGVTLEVASGGNLSIL
jgi:hypothetical protein